MCNSEWKIFILFISILILIIITATSSKVLSQTSFSSGMSGYSTGDQSRAERPSFTYEGPYTGPILSNPLYYHKLTPIPANASLVPTMTTPIQERFSETFLFNYQQSTNPWAAVLAEMTLLSSPSIFDPTLYTHIPDVASFSSPYELTHLAFSPSGVFKPREDIVSLPSGVMFRSLLHRHATEWYTFHGLAEAAFTFYFELDLPSQSDYGSYYRYLR